MRNRRAGPGCAVWETTLRCNLQCIHCGSAAGTARPDELSTEESLDLCKQLKGIDCGGIAMMGGEPLVRSDWLTIAKEIKRLGMSLSLITNGYRIPESTFESIEEIKPELVTVSLDGASPKTHDLIRGVNGSFSHAVSSLERFTEMGLPTGAITTVHKLNLSDLKGIRQILMGKGIAWQVQIATPFGRLSRDKVLSKEEYYSVAMFVASSQNEFTHEQLMVAGAHDMGYFSEFLPSVQLAPWSGCQAGISTLGIQSDGGIRGCLSLPESFNEGNIRDRHLKDIWYDDLFCSYSRQVGEEDIRGNCRKCNHRTICKGGCSAVSLSLYGELHQDPYCLRLIERELL
ncbi:MAG: radical SAM protein [Candidatus Thorarchaeota archaeon]